MMKNKHGVTLIELMIYSFLSFIVIAVILNAFFNTNKTFIEQRSSMLNTQDAREAINFMSFDLSTVGLKFYYYKDLTTGQYYSGNIDYSSYKSSGDLSSFKLTDQKDSLDDELTIRNLVLNDDGRPIDNSGNALDMSNVISANKSIIEERRYYVNNNQLHKEIKKIDYVGSIENVRSTVDYVVADNIKAFQVECGLVGSNQIIRDKGTPINPTEWNLSSVSYSYSNDELTFFDTTSTSYKVIYGLSNNIDLVKGSNYMFAFNLKGSGDILSKFKTLKLVLNNGTIVDTIGSIEAVGNVNNTINISYNASKNMENAKLEFLANLTSIASDGNFALSNLYIFEVRKGYVSWVGNEVGKKFWEESDGDYFPTHSQSEWVDNKKNVRILRVSLVTETKKTLSAERTYNYQIGNVNYNVTTKKENKIYRTVIPIEANGQFPTVQNTLGGGEDNFVSSSNDSTSSSVSSSSSSSLTSSSSSSTVSSSSSSSSTSAKRTLTVNSEGMGTVTPNSGTYDDGDVVTVTATADNGWEFDHWVGSVAVSTDAATTVTMTGDQTLTAVFKQLFSLTVSNTNGTVALDPDGGLYKDGTIVNLTATPNSGYVFKNWNGDISGTDNPYSVTMSGNYSAEAVFVTSYSIKNSVSDQIATIKVNGEILSYNNSISIESGNTVDIELSVKNGYEFSDWLGSLSGQGYGSSVLGYSISSNIELDASILGLIGDYSFEDDANDQSAYLHNGTVNGATFVQSCVDTKGLKFDGVNDYVDLGNFNSTGDQFSVSAWIMIDKFGEDPRIVSKSSGTSQTDHIWSLAVDDNSTTTGSLRFRLTTDNGFVEVHGGVIDVNKWYNVAAVYDGSAVSLYINGSSVTSSSITGDVKETTDPVWIGGSPAGATQRPFSGLMDEVKIYNKALNSTEISDLYTSHSSTCTNYDVVVNFDANNGNIAINGDNYTSGDVLKIGKYNNLSLTATASSGYVFDGWDGDLISTNNPEVLNVDTNKTVSAQFEVPSTPGSSPSNPITIGGTPIPLDLSNGFIYVEVPSGTGTIAFGHTGNQFSIKLIRVNVGTSNSVYNSWFQSLSTNGETLFKIENLNGVSSILGKCW